jgi:hypothetical protein
VNYGGNFVSKYNLKHLFEQVVNVSQNIEVFTVNELWKWTKFCGSNEYLNKTLNIHEESGVPIAGRKEILSEQIIVGDYLLFDYIEHLPQFSLKQCDNFDELIETIISESGILNTFTTLQMPIINGKAKNILFTLEYKNDKLSENKLEKETLEKIKDEIIRICK